MTILVIGAVIGLLVFIQSWVYKKFWRTGLSAVVKFSSKEAFEGDKLFLLEEFTNKKFLPLPWLFVEFKLSSHLHFNGDSGNVQGSIRAQRDLFSIKIFERIRRKIPFLASKRGFYTLREVGVKASNLLHTKRFEGYFGTYQELTVYPKLIDDAEDIAMLYKNMDAMMLSNALINPDPFEFKGIRDYMPTDSLKNINFKASAIQQQLMVNIHAPVSAKRLEVVLNLQPYSTHDYKEVYEQAIRLAATIASRYINQDVQLGFYTNGRDNNAKPTPRVNMGQSSAHLQSILSALAHLNTSNVPSPIAPHLEQITDNTAIYVIISSYYGEDLAAALRQLKESNISYMVIMPMEARHIYDAPMGDNITIWQATK
ncbi:MAG: DUF58 domain-containing protein [Defluviitaleaceae bacterium]|nr:DUF58 domain-containing protein [Defluviitaleaceae bacterium]